MSNFNETVPIKSFQAQTGTVGVTAAQLVGVKNQPAHKGVLIKNTHATFLLFVGIANVSATLGYELGVNESVFLETDDPASIFVVADTAATTYTWLAY